MHYYEYDRYIFALQQKVSEFAKQIQIQRRANDYDERAKINLVPYRHFRGKKLNEFACAASVQKYKPDHKPGKNERVNKKLQNR